MQSVTPLEPRTEARTSTPPSESARRDSHAAALDGEGALQRALEGEGHAERAFAPGSVLIEAGQVNSSLYLIVQGEVEVRLRDGQALTRLGHGDVVGEMSMVEDRPACATVMAVCPTTAIEVPRSAFWPMVEASHVFARRLLELLSKRLRENNDNLVSSAERSQRLMQEALQDGLTGARNRRWLERELAAWADEQKLNPRPFALGLLDIDHFKTFNDTHGHAAGDTVLKAFARALSGCVRSTDAVVRYGGEEFAVVLPGAPIRPAVNAMQRMQAAVSRLECRGPSGVPLPRIHFSAGVVSVEEFEPGRLLARADELLYMAKEQGRNRICGSNRL